ERKSGSTTKPGLQDSASKHWWTWLNVSTSTYCRFGGLGARALSGSQGTIRIPNGSGARRTRNSVGYSDRRANPRRTARRVLPEPASASISLHGCSTRAAANRRLEEPDHRSDGRIEEALSRTP